MKYSLILGSVLLGLTLVGTRAQAENPEHIRQLLRTGDCPNCDLSETSLVSLDLQNANLQGADLSGASLQSVQLNRANLTSADLSGAQFSTVNLIGANLQNANLSNTTSTFVCDANFYGYSEDRESCMLELLPIQLLPTLCNEGSELIEIVDLLETELGEFCTQEDPGQIAAFYAAYAGYNHLLNANLSLRGANLRDANLQNAKLTGADLRYATLIGTDATNADLEFAWLFDAELTDIKNADLSNTWATWQDLGDWFVTTQAKVEAQAQKDAGKIYIGAMGRAQQAYHLETDTFSAELAPLGLGMSEETETYRFGILEIDAANSVTQYALNKTGAAPNFLQVVYINFSPEYEESFPVSVLCQADMMDELAVSDLPEIILDTPDVNCPAGWEQIE